MSVGNCFIKWVLLVLCTGVTPVTQALANDEPASDTAVREGSAGLNSGDVSSGGAGNGIVGVDNVESDLTDTDVKIKEVNADTLLSAKIGVRLKSGKNKRRAKSNDNLAKGDELQIHVYPSDEAYVYLIHTDTKSLTLLNENEIKQSIDGMVSPSSEQYFKVDGMASEELVTVVISEQAIASVELLIKNEENLSGEMQFLAWQSLEQSLENKGRIDMLKKVDKPFSIAGNVRGNREDAFTSSLKVYSGNTVLVKKYAFQID